MPTFLGEADEGLGEFEQTLLLLDRARSEEEIDEGIGTLFRLAHTLKGNADSMGLEAICGCAHAIEGVLDAVRRRNVALTPSIVTVLLGGHDALRAMLATTAEGGTPSVATHEEAIQALVDASGGKVQEHPSGGVGTLESPGVAADGAPRRSLRVDLTTLDHAVSHAGELSIALSRL